MNNYNKFDLLKVSKTIQIPVHGSVTITLMAKCFIDNKYFQRLDKLKQLGTCDQIFPGAKHTRKEHSIGTYHLADRITKRIKETSNNKKMKEWLENITELKTHYEKKEYNVYFNDWIIELIKIAALCHDLGHGPFSHIFDDIFIKNSKYKDHIYAKHENRSCLLVEKIVKESEILSKYISANDILFIQTLIDPKPHNKGFIYQIVSNNLNGLDVDKYDYISRDTLHVDIRNGFDYSRLVDHVLVIDNNIVYPEQAQQDIYNLFATRHYLHKIAYCHKGVISAQYIVIEIMSILDKVIGISESVTDINKFLKMTDEYVLQYVEFIIDIYSSKNNPFLNSITTTDFKNLNILRNRLINHNLYPHISTFLTKEPILFNEEFNKKFNNSSYMIYKGKIGFVSGNKLNPLDNIYVYRTKDLFLNGHNVKAYRINKTDISYIIPDIYQEHITILYSKKNNSKSLYNDKLFLNSIKDNIIKN